MDERAVAMTGGWIVLGSRPRCAESGDYLEPAYVSTGYEVLLNALQSKSALLNVSI